MPWLKKFFAHANGVAIARAYTSSDWFHDYVVPHASAPTDGSIGTAPGHGVVLIGMGEVANTALDRSRLGWFVPLRRPVQPSIAQKIYEVAS